MAWSTFPTLTDGQVLTGAHMQNVRDNFAETAPAKATATGKLIVTTGANTVAQRTVQSVNIATQQTTTSTSYTNLTTTGPTVGPLTTGTYALAFATVKALNSTSGVFAKFGISVSGATTIAASDQTAYLHQTQAVNHTVRATYCYPCEGTLTPGLNQFQILYAVSAGTGQYEDRTLTVIAL